MSKITIYSPPATAQIKACAVDFDLRRAPVPVHLVQYDKTIPILAVSLYKGGSPYTLPADAEVNVRMNKRNNLCVYNPALGCNESRDVVYVAVTPQMTTQDGTFEPILEVVINSGVAGTSPMQLVIRRNPVQEDAIEDTSEGKTLTELVSQAAASATAAAQSAGAAAEDAGKAAASATAAAESDEHAAATAKNIKDSLDQIASNAAAVSQLKEDTAKLKDGKISKFYASSQGDTNLPDSDDGRIMDLMLYGKSEQKQYSGKNLLNAVLETTTSNGVTCTANGDGTYTVNGTAPDGVNSYFSIVKSFTVKAGKKYKLVGCPAGGDMDAKYALFHRNNWRVDVGNGSTFTQTEDATDYISIKICGGFTANNLVFKPMLVDADTYPDASYNDYEPYVGGIPSPNPEYPQEIKSVVKPRVKVCGKNLVGELMPGTIVFNTGDYNSGQAGYECTDFIPVKPGEKYTISNATGGAEKWYYNADKKAIESMPRERNITVTIPNGVAYMRVSCYAENKDKFQIELGSTATNYQPYTEISAKLPYTLNAIPVTSGGNVTIAGQQYIADYVDVERGKLVRMCKEIDFEKVDPIGEQNLLTNSREIRYSTNSIGIKALPASTPSNEAGFITSIRRLAQGLGTWNIDQVGVWQCGQGENNNILVIRAPLATVLDVVAYFKSIGGCKGVFQAATPTETDLTADEIAAFKALASYYPVTNVSTTSDQLDGYTVFDYPISLANGWNYVKQQLGDTRDYLYGIDLMTAEAYVNSEYAAALAEIEV